MRKEVVKKVVEVVEYCPKFRRVVLVSECMSCGYFGGFTGFKKIKCKFYE